MHTYSFAGDLPQVVRLQGAFSELRGEGLAISRLPASVRHKTPEGLDVMARMPSGARLQFQTTATEIGLQLQTTAIANPTGDVRPVAIALESDGQFQTQTIAPNNRLVPDPKSPRGYRSEHDSDSGTAWFKDLSTGSKYCEIWLPHNAFVTIQELKTNEPVQSLVPDTRSRWVHYGSSISHCMEAESPATTWPAVAARIAGFNLTSFGVGGQCHLDQVVARTITALEPKPEYISIKVGINVVNLDSMRERVFVPAAHGFLDTIRESLPDVPITLISPIYCPSAETNPGPTIPRVNGKFETIDRPTELSQGALSLSRIRTILETVVKSRQSAEGDQNLSYFNGLELFSEEDAHDLPDDLHPNPAGYIRMGERYASKHLLSLNAK